MHSLLHVGTEYKLKQRVIFGLENKPLQENPKKYSMVNLSSGLLYTKTVPGNLSKTIIFSYTGICISDI